MNGRVANSAGYILLEAVVALGVLSVGSLVVHGTIQDAIQTRGQAQDYTRARFLLESLVADIEVQPQVVEQEEQGRFEGRSRRFRWDYTVRRMDVPVPAAPIKPPPPRTRLRRFAYIEGNDYLAHVQATVRWERGGRRFEESVETLLPARKLWQPRVVAR